MRLSGYELRRSSLHEPMLEWAEPVADPAGEASACTGRGFILVQG
jgi:hypothetical protein